MTAEIICVGTELLLGDIVNTNARFLSRELAELGISVLHQHVIGDNPPVCGHWFYRLSSAAICWCSPAGLAPPRTI